MRLGGLIVGSLSFPTFEIGIITTTSFIELLWGWNEMICMKIEQIPVVKYLILLLALFDTITTFAAIDTVVIGILSRQLWLSVGDY